MSNPQKGLVYVLSNPAMPGLVKIGQTTNEITSRMNELSNTGVPLHFECLIALRNKGKYVLMLFMDFHR